MSTNLAYLPHKKPKFRQSANHAGSAGTLDAAAVEAVENPVEVVDNSSYQNLQTELWKPYARLNPLIFRPFPPPETASRGRDYTARIALDGTGGNVVDYSCCMTDGSGEPHGVQRRGRA